MFKLREIEVVTGGKLLDADPEKEIKGVSTDSRTVKEEDLFFAIRGPKFDGADFAMEAVEKGASCVILPFGKGPSNIPRILVDSPILALGRLANYKIKKMSTRVIGITGSVGKTTTKELIYTLLSARFKVYKSKKSYNNNIGLPLTILNAPQDIDYLVLEYGTNHPGEISYLTYIARPHIAVLTRVARSHLEFFVNTLNVAIEKAGLFEALPPRGIAIVNAETIHLNEIERRIPPLVKKIFYGVEKGDVKPVRYTLEEDKTKFLVDGEELILPIPGKGMLENAMAAIVVAKELGIPLHEMKELLRNFRDESMRMEIINLESGFKIVNDAYNSNPDSLLELFKTFREHKGKRLIFVLGDMLELGDKAPELHREAGEQFVATGHKILFTCGELAKFISEEAAKRGAEVHHFQSKRDLQDALLNFVKQGDIILFKASRAMQFEDIIKNLEEKLK